MENQFLFIIWNKARFCEKKIIDDISNSFKIDKILHVTWDKNKFGANIMALYGTKIPNLKEKLKIIGTGEFTVIIVSDMNNNYEMRKTYNGLESVNSLMYDKKWLYRNWTGGQFRIHGTQTKLETSHDLTVLFGPNYDSFIAMQDNFGHLTTNTYENSEYKSFDDFQQLIKSFDINSRIIVDDELFILTSSRKDLLFFLKKTNGITINKVEYNVVIYGEKEGDIPINFIKTSNNDMLNEFVSIKTEYKEFLKDRSKFSQKIKTFYEKYNLMINDKPIETLRPHQKSSLSYKIKHLLKYILCKIRYS